MPNIRADAAFLEALRFQRVFPPTLKVPILCWLTPTVPARIEALIRRVGTVRRFDAGDYIFGERDYYDHLVMLTKGIGGRAFGSEFNQTTDALALSVPGRIIGGNHCFFSGLPGVGRYFLLSSGEAVAAPRAAILQALREDVGLFEEFAAFLDQLFQADRLGFGAIALLSVQKRLLLWALSWGFTYGGLREKDGETYLVLEPMLSAQLLKRVVSANLSQVKRDLAQLKGKGIFRREGRTLWVLASSLDDVWNWLCDSEESTAVYRRPRDWRPYIRNYPRVGLERSLKG